MFCIVPCPDRCVLSHFCHRFLVCVRPIAHWSFTFDVPFISIWLNCVFPIQEKCLCSRCVHCPLPLPLPHSTLVLLRWMEKAWSIFFGWCLDFPTGYIHGKIETITQIGFFLEYPAFGSQTLLLLLLVTVFARCSCRYWCCCYCNWCSIEWKGEHTEKWSKCVKLLS